MIEDPRPLVFALAALRPARNTSAALFHLKHRPEVKYRRTSPPVLESTTTENPTMTSKSAPQKTPFLRLSEPRPLDFLHFALVGQASACRAVQLHGPRLYTFWAPFAAPPERGAGTRACRLDTRVET